MDGLSFLGRFFGTFYQSVWPSTNPKRTYLLNSFAIALLLCCIPLMTYVPTAARSILLISFSLVGFGRGIYVLPFYLVNQYFKADSKKDQTLISVWFASLGIGDFLGLSIVEILIKYGYASWQTSFLVFIAVFLISSIVMDLCLDDISR